MLKKILPTILSVICLMAAWQIIAWGIGYPEIFPPLPQLILNVCSLFLLPEFYNSLLITIIRGLIGFFIAFVIAFLSSTLTTFSSFWKSFFHPIIVVLRSIPVISLVLIALIWFSPSNLPVFIAIITMFPILYQNISNGFEKVDYKLVEMAKVFGKTPLQQFLTVFLPSAKSLIFSGISTAMGFGWRAIIIGEVLAQPIHGIGTSMKKAQVFINISELIAWTIIAIAISYFFEFLILEIEKISRKHYFKTNNNVKINKNVKVDYKSITLNNISKSYPSESVFNSFSASFNSETVTFIKAPSGKGKTTLLRLLTHLEKPTSEEIKYEKTFRFAYSFQDQRLLPWLTVSENIVYGMHHNELNKQDILNYLLEKTELADQRNKYPDELSGGQNQRVSIARSLAANSDILVLDEPLNGLDAPLKIKILNLIEDWISVYKPLVVWATHENFQFKSIKSTDLYL